MDILFRKSYMFSSTKYFHNSVWEERSNSVAFLLPLKIHDLWFCMQIAGLLSLTDFTLETRVCQMPEIIPYFLPVMASALPGTKLVECQTQGRGLGRRLCYCVCLCTCWFLIMQERVCVLMLISGTAYKPWFYIWIWMKRISHENDCTWKWLHMKVIKHENDHIWKWLHMQVIVF